jgi:hypothetical protein
MSADRAENTFIAIILIADFVDFAYKLGLARSIDFTPLDYFWGWHMMDMVTQERSLTRAELLQKIVEYTD